jgi:hypothetical protein
MKAVIVLLLKEVINMDALENHALKITADIVVATVSSTHVGVDQTGGEFVGEYFDAIYKKVLSLVKGNS